MSSSPPHFETMSSERSYYILYSAAWVRCVCITDVSVDLREVCRGAEGEWPCSTASIDTPVCASVCVCVINDNNEKKRRYKCAHWLLPCHVEYFSVQPLSFCLTGFIGKSAMANETGAGRDGCSQRKSLSRLALNCFKPNNAPSAQEMPKSRIVSTANWAS